MESKCLWGQKRQKAWARMVGEAVAESMFRDFQDVTNQGTAFTWERFPRMIQRLARAQAAVQFPGRVSGLMLDFAGRCALRKAQTLVKGHGTALPLCDR